MLLIVTRPYKENIVTWMALINELMIFAIGCYMFGFLMVDIEGSVHAWYAKVITALLITTVATNLLLVIYTKIRDLCLAFMRYIRLRKLKQMARIERRFREFDTMRYVLHGLHLKDHYRFVRKKPESIEDYR